MSITLGKMKLGCRYIKLHLQMIRNTLLIFLARGDYTITIPSKKRLSFHTKTIKLQNFFLIHNPYF